MKEKHGRWLLKYMAGAAGNPKCSIPKTLIKYFPENQTLMSWYFPGINATKILIVAYYKYLIYFDSRIYSILSLPFSDTYNF